jgi:acyl-coenzyme A synthetase/AMP-(fatty) acid ligase
VIGVEHASWGQIIVAAVVPDGQTSPDTESLARLPHPRPRGVPRRIPANASGKVLRRELAGIVLKALAEPSL